jgi:hypothetical protein
MYRFRRRLTCAWLMLELAAFAAAPIVMFVDRGHPSGTHRQKACCPGIAPGQICPMHHAREGGRTCTMTSGCREDAVALLSLIAVAGVPALTARGVSLSATADLVQPLTATPIARAELPESPPPRA